MTDLPDSLRLTYARFDALISAAGECLDAYQRLANEITGLATSTDLPGDIIKILTNTELRPSIEAMTLLRAERNLCDIMSPRVNKNREAVRRWRARHKGEPKAHKQKRNASRPPELFAPADYEAIAAQLQEEERAAVIPQPLIDATPKVGKATLDF